MKKRAEIVLITALAFCLIQVLTLGFYLTSAASDQSRWAVYAHDSQRTGRSPYFGPSSPTLEWELDNLIINANLQYCRAIAIGGDDTVYVGVSDKVQAIKDAQERTLWQSEGCTVYSVAVGYDGTIYAGASYDIGTAEEHGIVHALRQDGTEKWRAPVVKLIYNPLAIGPDGTIYVLTHHGPLYAIGSDGNLKWTKEVGVGGNYGGVAIGPNGVIYAGFEGGYVDYENFENGGLYAYNQDGAEIWHSTIWPDAQLVVGDDETIYAVGYDGLSLERAIFALNSNGTVKWTNTQSYPHFHPAIGQDGTLYMTYGGDRLDAINPSDGTVKWTIHVPTVTDTAPIIDANNTIYIGGGENISAINPDGSLKWMYEKEGQPIAIDSQGRIYYSHSLYAIGGTRSPMSWGLIGGIVAALVIIAATMVLYGRRRF